MILESLSFNSSHAQAISKSDTARVVANKISQALDMYFVDCHEFPEKLEALIVKPENCQFWGPDPYLKDIPSDPWGRVWSYRRQDSKSYELISLGADGRLGGSGQDLDFVHSGRAPVLNK